MARRTAYDSAASFEARTSFALGGRQYKSGDDLPRGAVKEPLQRKMYDDWMIDVKGSPTAPGTSRVEATPPPVGPTKVTGKPARR